MADEVQRLVMEVVNRQKVEELNEVLRKEEQFIRAANDALKDGMITQAQFDGAAARSASQVLSLRGQVEQLAGKRGLGGGGILQASYAVQDFTSVLSGGQGLERALSSVQNNIPGMLMSLGVSGGLAGVVSLVSVAIGALIPLVEKLWGSLDDKEVIEAAKGRLREFKAEIDRTHKAFQDLATSPTDPEKLSAEGIGLFLKERPNAERARAAVASGVSEAEARGALTPDEQQKYWASADAADRTDDQLRSEAADRAREAFASMGGEGAPPDSLVESHYRESLRARHDARAERAGLMLEGRRRRGEAAVAGATVAGPAGAAAREALLGKTLGVPGLEELQQYQPARIERAERDFEAQQGADEQEAARVQEYRENRRKAREARVQQRQNEIQGRKNSQAYDRAQAAKAEAAEAAEGRALEHDDATNLRDFQQGKKTAPLRSAKARVSAEAQAQGLGRPTDAQADEMARDVLALTRQGVATNDAILSAVASKAQEVQRLQMRLEQQRAQALQLQMGADQSGQFSLLPPMW